MDSESPAGVAGRAAGSEPAAAVGRQPVHRRRIEMDAFLRDDGLWDLEIVLTDTKARDFEGAARGHPAGTPIHHLGLTVTVDSEGTIAAVQAGMAAVPYEGVCQGATADYQVLVGLNLFAGLRPKLRERIRYREGCSHLSDLALMLPALAIQSFAGIVYPLRDDGVERERPFPIDRCRGLRTDGEAVRMFFSRWYEKPGG